MAFEFSLTDQEWERSFQEKKTLAEVREQEAETEPPEPEAAL